jgi:heme-degrading monooxygenase HmoA
MPFVSVTRLHLRSKWYYPSFIISSYRAAAQARRSAGFITGVLGGDAHGAGWTLTVWESEPAMRAYRNSGLHMRVMPKLLEWCDEASFAHWAVDDPALPSMEEAHRRMITDGRLSKVNHPSSAHAAGRTAMEGPPRVGLTLTRR